MRVAVLSQSTRLVHRVIRPLARPAHPPRPVFYDGPRGAAASHEFLAKLAGREARDEGSALNAWSPSSFLLPSTRLSPMHRRVDLECPRRQYVDQRPSFQRPPAKGAVFPKTEGAFHRTFHVPGKGGFPR